MKALGCFFLLTLHVGYLTDAAGNHADSHHLCKDFVCHNDGQCTAATIHHEVVVYCECKHNFVGQHCETPSCHDTHCQNGGKCHEHQVQHTYKEASCTCPNGYTGSHCERVSVPATTATHSTLFTTTFKTASPSTTYTSTVSTSTPTVSATSTPTVSSTTVSSTTLQTFIAEVTHRLMALDSENQPYRGQLQRPARKLYQGVVLYDKLNDEIEEIAKMDVLEDDIWICSFPRSGTTLTQELVYLIQTLDFDTAKSVQLEQRVPFVDWKMDAHPYFKGLKNVEQLKSPRMIKSHLHHFLLPEALQKGKGRIIYICRNPKDVAVSFFRFLTWTEMIHDEYNTMDPFVDKFKDGLLYACPWQKHILGYWERRHDPKLLFLKFEDVVKNLPAAILRIADFLNRSLSSEDVAKIAEHCSVENMRMNEMVNMKYMSDLKPMNTDEGGAFINKGLPGGWHGVLTTEQSAKIDEMIKELEGTGLEFACT